MDKLNDLKQPIRALAERNRVRIGASDFALASLGGQLCPSIVAVLDETRCNVL